ncbi:M12 family metallopeptidase [Amycolatopsis sp. cg5]|uniref:M12 family metallopeptidase n=1 Tax=Amycolatopsis sp. cg5 TaxID=3238802 RepID=UPI00352497AF
MGVIKKNAGRWSDHIPYEYHTSVAAGSVAAKWLDQKVKEFNDFIGKEVFQPRSGEADYAVFDLVTGNCNSAIGKQGGRQVIQYKEDTGGMTVHHEMGHCVGMGHENFHPDYPYKTRFTKGSIPEEQWKRNHVNYEGHGDFDNESIMRYTAASLEITLTGVELANDARRQAMSKGDKATVLYLMT